MGKQSTVNSILKKNASLFQFAELCIRIWLKKTQRAIFYMEKFEKLFNTQDSAPVMTKTIFIQAVFLLLSFQRRKNKN